MTMQLLVYNGIEVKYTGRIAKKPSKLNPGKFQELREIIPADPELMQKPQWVDPSELYTIDETNQ